MTQEITKALELAKRLKIMVIQRTDNFDTSGEWSSGRTITINPKTADVYTILHEIGHVLNGYMCCREHCEYAAHGAAIALAYENNIQLPEGAERRIDVYAGRSSRKACGAIKEKEKENG